MRCTSPSVRGPCCLGQSLAELCRHVPGGHSRSAALARGCPARVGHAQRPAAVVGTRVLLWLSTQPRAAWDADTTRAHTEGLLKQQLYRLGPCCKYGERQERPQRPTAACTACGAPLTPRPDPTWPAAQLPSPGCAGGDKGQHSPSSRLPACPGNPV